MMAKDTPNPIDVQIAGYQQQLEAVATQANNTRAALETLEGQRHQLIGAIQAAHACKAALKKGEPEPESESTPPAP